MSPPPRPGQLCGPQPPAPYIDVQSSFCPWTDRHAGKCLSPCIAQIKSRMHNGASLQSMSFEIQPFCSAGPLRCCFLPIKQTAQQWRLQGLFVFSIYSQTLESVNKCHENVMKCQSREGPDVSVGTNQGPGSTVPCPEMQI